MKVGLRHSIVIKYNGVIVMKLLSGFSESILLFKHFLKVGNLEVMVTINDCYFMTLSETGLKK